jgi:hypothetical protein
MFAFSSKDNLVVKLPQERVDALVASGKGKRHDPGRGRVQREWLAVKPTHETSLLLAKEAMKFAASKR